ncbi:54S ribosomal protein img2, mitochondrial [Rhodotorula toruloides]
MQRFRPLLTALPTLRARAAPPSALPFLRFSSSSPSRVSEPSPAPAASAEPEASSALSKDPAGGFTKPKKEVQQPKLTYFVPRTSFGELPVYTDYKQQGRRVLTVIRKTRGELTDLQQDIRKYIPESHPYIRPAAGALVLRGNWAREVKEFLWSKGF